MKVHLYTDGSMDVAAGKGGWAAWIQLSEHRRVVQYGACPDYVKQANHAEMFAIFAGIKLALAEWGAEIRAFRICSDSESALRHVRRGPLGTPTRDRVMLRLRAKIHELLKGKQIIAEHVKGHQNPELGYDFFVNNKVDRFAGRGRKRIKGPFHMRLDEVLELTPGE
jgi:ribonuclease HI